MINKSAGVRNVFSSAHIERGRGSSSAELIHFGLQHFCYPCAVCARVMRLCPSICVCVCVCVCVSSKNTLVYVSPFEIRHKNALCCLFTEFIVLRKTFTVS